MKSGWSRGARESSSTASITNSPPIRKGIDESTREHYARFYALPHAMHDALEQFVAFPQDGIDNRALLGQGEIDHAGAGHRAGINPTEPTWWRNCSLSRRM